MTVIARSIILAGFALSACEASSSTPEEVEAQRLLERVLPDASTARFQQVRSVEATASNGNKGRIICGEVNSTNRLGAYDGYRRFVAVPDEGFATIDPRAGPGSSTEAIGMQAGFDSVWPACEGKSLVPSKLTVGGCDPEKAESVGLSCKE